MDKFSDISEYREPTEKEHRKIVCFLRKYHFPEYVGKQKRYFNEDKKEYIELNNYERKLLPNYLGQVIDGFNVEFRIICERLGYKDKSATNVSRLTKALNYYLKELYKEKNVDPPIQLFFFHKNRSGKVANRNCHLACAEIGKQDNNRRYSYKIITLEEAEKRGKLGTQGTYQETVQQQTLSSSIQPDKLKLYKPTIKIELDKKQNLLAYKYRWPETIYGRNKEREQLHEFVNYEGKNLLWWAITGNGGTGKSRLALELCFKLDEQGWHAGFLTDPKEIDVLSDWKPIRPTLIVIDYTYEKSEKLGECIKNYMYENSKQWDFPVRILFLERYAKSEALERFCRCEPDIIDSNLLYRKSTNADESRFLELKSLSGEAIDLITTEVFKRKRGQNEEPSDEILETIRTFLKEKVRENNPLYAMILAEAWTENEKVQEWDIGDLLGWHLKYTRKIWKKADIDENNDLDRKHINLLTLATLTGGVNIRSSEYDECLDITHGRSRALDILPIESEFKDHKYKILCEDDARELSPMTPDILGEHFVLDRWKRSIADECEMELLTKVAWRYKPFGMIDFLTRAAMDFPTDEKLDGIVELAKSDSGRHLERAVLLFDLIVVYCNARKTDKVVNHYACLEDLWKSGYQKDKDISLMLANAAVNLTCYYDKAEELDKAVEGYNRVKDLWKSGYQKDKDISVMLARAIVNLMYCYGEARKLNKAVECYNRIEDLWKSGYQEDKEFSFELARAAVSLTYRYSKAGKLNKAVEYYNRVEHLWKSGYQKDKDISLKLAGAAVNLMCGYGEVGKLKYYNCVEDLWKSGYQKDKDISVMLATATLNLMYCYSEDGKLNKAVEYYNRIEGLWKSGYQRNEDISLVLAKAAIVCL